MIDYKNDRHIDPYGKMIYKVEICQIRQDNEIIEKYKKYKFKDLGYLILYCSQDDPDDGVDILWYWHGFITVEELKERIGVKQYRKFCQGKRKFV